MTTAAVARRFVDKWERATINEKAAAHSHFNELCEVLGQPSPTTADPTGQWYRFEKQLTKAGGGIGYADVWKRDFFAWEYKSKGKYPDLRAAYQQLLLYKEALDNPPILVASDIANYEIHISFTGHKTRIEKFTNADIATVSTRDLLRLVFTDPQQLRPSEKVFTVTERIAEDFAQVAQWVESRKHSPQRVAHFFMKLMFAMFAEDIGLLPHKLLTSHLRAAIMNPDEFNAIIQPLFRAMRDGGYLTFDTKIHHFNGGLFDDDDAIPLTVSELERLYVVATQDWSQVEPSIFGTVLERSLDPQKRKQLGAHYTSREDIVRIVEPVLMHPLRLEWATTLAKLEPLRVELEQASGAPQQRLVLRMQQLLYEFMDRLGRTTVLDPACGSGNFLYVALQKLKNLEHEVIQYAVSVGLPEPAQVVSPRQLYGIELNPFAAELAQVVVWIGHLQWNKQNNYDKVATPVLTRLDNIRCTDALITYTSIGTPVEPDWPKSDVIVGNPPFLGGSKLRRKLSSAYVEELWSLYNGRVPRGADLVTYWFEKSRASIQDGRASRAGLLATQSIRVGANRKVLDRIKASGEIFFAEADRPWILEDAAVRVSMIGFDDGREQQRTLNGSIVEKINPDLSHIIDVTVAKPLHENGKIAFVGSQKAGAFDIPESVALQMLQAPINANGRPNSDVVRPSINGKDITDHPRHRWIIDFGVGLSEHDAQAYELPFEYVRTHVYPKRLTNNRPAYVERWWQHAEPRPGMRIATKNLFRFIVTVRVSRHRTFAWLQPPALPDHKLCVFARDDDYFFGVLHSSVHKVWTLANPARHGVGNDPTYNADWFTKFPFPWAPGHEPTGDPRVDAIAAAARDVVQQRDEWLNPPSLFGGTGATPKDRTLTNLYNKQPDWLVAAHRRLDQAVLDAYGWPHDLTDDEILARLLALNLERAANQGAALEKSVGAAPESDE